MPGVLHDHAAGGRRPREGDAIHVHVQGQRLARGLAQSPGTTLNTPSGIPASTASSAIRMAVSGDFSEGLSTNELPAASTGPIFQAAMSSGKFHGTIAPTTPIGSRVINASVSRSRRRHLVIDLVDGFGIPTDAVRAAGNVDAQTVADGLAHVERLEQRQLLAMFADEIGETLATPSCACAGARFAQLPLRKAARAAANGAIDVLGVTRRDACKQLARWRD